MDKNNRIDTERNKFALHNKIINQSASVYSLMFNTYEMAERYRDDF